MFLKEELNMVNQKMEREREESRRRIAEKDKLLSKRALQINTLQGMKNSWVPHYRQRSNINPNQNSVFFSWYSKAQLKELAYSPRNYKRTMPIQYTWPAGDQEVEQPIEDDMPFSQLRAGESLLEIHLKVYRCTRMWFFLKIQSHFHVSYEAEICFSFCVLHLQSATFSPTGLRTMSSIHPRVDGGEDIVTFCTYSLLDFEVHSTPLVSGSQPNYSFTSRYALTARDLGRLGGQGSRVRVELHQALGGVRFVTHGSGQMSLMGAMEKRAECIGGRVNITGK